MPAAVARARPALVAAIDAIGARLERGGRLVYVGTGTSGRLALVDAMEIESTFGFGPDRVVALVAGDVGNVGPQEHAEDDAAAGAREVRALGLRPDDAVVGISASGRTPYVLGALEEARLAEARDRRRHVRRRLGARRARRPRGRGGRRGRGRLRLDAAQGRHRAEARAQHDLDRGDDPARQDLRQPDGRRRRHERQAQGAAAEDRLARHRRAPRQTSTTLSSARTGTRRSQSSAFARVSTSTTARERLAAADGVVRKAIGT